MPLRIKVIQESGSDRFAAKKFENMISEYIQEQGGNNEIHYSTCVLGNQIMYSALIITTYDNFETRTDFTTTATTGETTDRITFNQPSGTTQL